jgi:hypothetical protein
MMSERFLAFDLEIAKVVPDGEEDWSKFRPFGISCAATYRSDGLMQLWSGVPSMTPEQCMEMTDTLVGFHEDGWTLVTWNGLGFDLDVLAEECGDEPYYTGALRTLALDHIDVGFAMFCEKGYMVGLDTAAKGMGLEGKLEGMTGALAPVMWAKGDDERAEVLEYVIQDARVTGMVYASLISRGRLRWISKKGRLNYWRVGNRIRTVAESLKMPEPNTAWMDDPWKRSKFAGWLDAEAV